MKVLTEATGSEHCVYAQKTHVQVRWQKIMSFSLTRSFSVSLFLSQTHTCMCKLNIETNTVVNILDLPVLCGKVLSCLNVCESESVREIRERRKNCSCMLTVVFCYQGSHWGSGGGCEWTGDTSRKGEVETQSKSEWLCEIGMISIYIFF